MNNRANLSETEIHSEYKSKISSFYKRGYLTQIKWVLWRSWLINTREPLLSTIRIAQTFVSEHLTRIIKQNIKQLIFALSTLKFFAFLLGFIYFGQEYNQESIMNIDGALFILLANITFTNAFAVINVSTFRVDFFSLVLINIVIHSRPFA